ncbi:MAG: glycosyltransferase N-terminal domain-containing protein [Owenweeksia sp.]|nr:glycosyltransferase N-terminal domain-containing protein [Owenweeksia sp.]
MYHWLYNTGIALYTAGIRLATAFNTKARDWTQGRKAIFKRLSEELTTDDNPIWFHAASLGGAEPGVPIMQALKQLYPHRKILLTFFSPSGKNHFKKQGLADFSIFYLPADSPGNARRFLAAVKPSLAFFIKYEIWG